MNWDALGAIAEVIAAIAVVLSLVYLAKQIGEGNKAAKQAGRFNSLNGQLMNVGVFIDNPDMAELWIKTNPSSAALYEQFEEFDLTMTEKVRMGTYLNMVYRRWEYVFTEFSESELNVNYYRKTVETEFNRWFWDATKQEYDSDFVDYIDKKVLLISN